ncbi:hypothetical protein ANN_21092 [Periplaneta americana]|uniref:Uncharacterized protein n=1 Tax=Periplaneta americana TaxID=6978 RepID=A0ABQ8SEU2_PERAM|nr:hypothetical protein ANN_21092 [Periplaneta americana]
MLVMSQEQWLNCCRDGIEKYWKSSYSHDMSPCDYDLFPHRAKRFPDIASVLHAVGQFIRESNRNNLANGTKPIPSTLSQLLDMYGSEAVITARLNKLKTIQNNALRLIAGVIKTIPITTVQLYANHKRVLVHIQGICIDENNKLRLGLKDNTAPYHDRVFPKLHFLGELARRILFLTSSQHSLPSGDWKQNLNSSINNTVVPSIIPVLMCKL